MLKFNYHHLYYFRTIATEGSISKAAAKLLLGQPTLSMQLKQFEEFLGHELFERRNRSLVLTEMGRVVLNYANEIFRLGDEMLDTIRDRPSEKKILLQVGALDSVPKALTQELVFRALEIMPSQISVFEGEGNALMQDLLEHRLDLVLSNAPAPSFIEKKLFSKSLCKMPLIVVGAPAFGKYQRDFPNSLRQQNFVLPTAHSRVRHDFEHFLESNQLSVNVLAETQDTSLLLSMALAGKAMTVMAAPAVADFLQTNKLVKIGDLKSYFEEIWLIASQRKMQNPLGEKLLKTFSPST